MEKKEKQITFWLTQNEFDELNEFIKNHYQSRSDFIRSSIWEKMREIQKERYQILKIKSNGYRAIMGELKGERHALTNLDKETINQREEYKRKRKSELEQELKRINESLEKSK